MSILTSDSYNGDFDATDLPDATSSPFAPATPLTPIPPSSASSTTGGTPYCMMQKGGAQGGAFVNAGTYGCAFSPPLKCTVASKNPKSGVKAVGKVFSKQQNFLDELSEIQEIEKFDKDHLFTIPYLGNCATSKSSFKPDDEVSKCSRHITRSKQKYDQILFQYGGVDLSTIYEKPMDHPIYLDNLFRIALPVFEGIQRMIQHEVAHSDIKPPNMLCDTKADPAPRMYLIDFGLLTPFPKLKTSFFMHAHRYPYYPPEFRIFNSRREGIFDTQLILQFCLDNFAYLQTAKFIHWLSQRWPSYMLEMQRVVEDMNALSFRTILMDFDRVYASLVDTYGVAMTLVEIIYRLETTGNGRVRNLVFFDKFLTGVLFPMIHPNPYRRISMAEAIKRSKALYQTYPFVVTKANFFYYMLPTKSQKIVAHPITPTLSDTSSKSAQKPKMMTEEECQALKGKVIKETLKGYHQPTYGNKAMMCKRLVEYLQKAHQEHQQAKQILQETLQREASRTKQVQVQVTKKTRVPPKQNANANADASVMPSPVNSTQLKIDKVYKKSLRNCNKSDANGGYPIKDLRNIAIHLDLKEKKKRKEICDELTKLRLPDQL